MKMKGATLIEVLIALAIASVVISTVTVVTITTLSNATYIRNQDQSTKYAQEGMEIMRRIRNSNYRGFLSYSGTYCLAKNQTTLGVPQSSCTTPNVDSFIRSVTIEQSPGCGINIAKVTVMVSWTDGRCTSGVYCHKSDLTSCLSTVSPL